jgi:tol-pal system protein YbgF
MRIRTQRVLLAATLAASWSCAAQQRPGDHTADDAVALDNMREKQAEQARRIEELESRIALLEADARSQRAADGGSAHAPDTIRIGEPRARETPALTAAHAEPVAQAAGSDAAEEEAARGVKRPHLRLYGSKSAGEYEKPSTDRDVLPVVPAVDETLPVVPLPEQRAAQLRGSAPSGGAEAGIIAYRGALKLLRERHFDEAVAAFADFMAQHPRNGLVGNALYWRGEAHYAKREYAPALADFEALLERDPRGEKAADALLKSALCFRKLGSEDKAREALRRLRSDFPNSQAATLAAREGST